MSYLNNQIGYRDDLLETRSVIKKNNFVLLEVDGLVKNAIPGYSGCDTTILGSPEMGASFVDYFVTAHDGGSNTGIGGDGIETFLYVISGKITVKNDTDSAELTEGGYIYSPAGNKLTFVNNSGSDAKLYVYKRRYVKIDGYDVPGTIIGNKNELPEMEYEGMHNVFVQDFLPAGGNFSFDMNMHILKFKLGASHGYIETHVQEHGLYFLSGKGMYRLDNDWVPVKEGDYIFMDAYCPQACYAVGKEDDLVYIYSKDCNRDIEL